MTEKEQAILWLGSFVKNKEPMILVPKPLIRLMHDVLTQKPKTNYDRIISKTPEELARYMTEVQMYAGCPNDGAMDCRDNCALCWLDWLKQEVTE